MFQNLIFPVQTGKSEEFFPTFDFFIKRTTTIFAEKEHTLDYFYESYDNFSFLRKFSRNANGIRFEIYHDRSHSIDFLSALLQLTMVTKRAGLLEINRILLAQFFKEVDSDSASLRRICSRKKSSEFELQLTLLLTGFR